MKSHSELTWWRIRWFNNGTAEVRIIKNKLAQKTIILPLSELCLNAVIDTASDNRKKGNDVRENLYLSKLMQKSLLGGNEEFNGTKYRTPCLFNRSVIRERRGRQILEKRRIVSVKKLEVCLIDRVPLKENHVRTYPTKVTTRLRYR